MRHSFVLTRSDTSNAQLLKAVRSWFRGPSTRIQPATSTNQVKAEHRRNQNYEQIELTSIAQYASGITD